MITHEKTIPKDVLLKVIIWGNLTGINDSMDVLIPGELFNDCIISYDDMFDNNITEPDHIIVVVSLHSFKNPQYAIENYGYHEFNIRKDVFDKLPSVSTIDRMRIVYKQKLINELHEFESDLGYENWYWFKEIFSNEEHVQQRNEIILNFDKKNSKVFHKHCLWSSNLNYYQVFNHLVFPRN